MTAPLRREYQLYADIVRHGIMTMDPGDNPNRIQISLHHHPQHPDLLVLANNVLQLGPASCLECLCVGHFLAEGPKDFWLGDVRDYEALEQFSLDLPSREYTQPFPTLRILLPDDYSRNRIVPFECWLDNTAGLHRPYWMICHHKPGAGRFNLLVHMTSGQCLTKSIRLNCDETLEQAWSDANKPHGQAVANTGEKLNDPLVQSRAEEELSNALSRLALAANLLLMVYGTRKVGLARWATTTQPMPTGSRGMWRSPGNGKTPNDWPGLAGTTRACRSGTSSHRRWSSTHMPGRAKVAPQLTIRGIRFGPIGGEVICGTSGMGRD